MTLPNTCSWRGLMLVVASLSGSVQAQTYTVTRGQRVERTLNVPCALEFDVMGKQPTNEGTTPGAPGLVEEHLGWAVAEGRDWSGGNPPAGTYAAAFRDYKLKLYSVTQYAGERRIWVPWSPPLSYRVRMEIKIDRAEYTVRQGGAVVSSATVSGAAPARVTMGYGWPPSVRNGAEGAVLTNIRWDEASAPATTPQPPPATCGAARCFAPVADTWVDPSALGSVNGASGELRVGGDGRVIYLRFDVRGLMTSVSSARLVLKALNAGGAGQAHAVADTSWAEGAVSFASRPALGVVLSTQGRVELGATAAFDVTRAVAGDGQYAFAISSLDPDGSGYFSRESADVKPVLEVTPGPRPAFPEPPDAGPPPDAGNVVSQPAPSDGGATSNPAPTGTQDAGTAPPPSQQASAPAGEGEAREVAAMTGGCSSTTLLGCAPLAAWVLARRRRGRRRGTS
ncbi:MAG: hypothetical protein JNJ54_14705 [Myxococcaceae bacterium]|nr:hypothetical protein [Myxococcaceae bacterium]